MRAVDRDLPAFLAALLIIAGAVLAAERSQPEPAHPACVHTSPDRLWCVTAYVPSNP